MRFQEAMLELDLNSSTSLPAMESGQEIGSLQLLLASPRGFCAGVRRAIDAVRDALAKHGPPVYVRRPIVHNRDVVRTLEAEGAIFVEELEDVPQGSIVIFSAHGVSPRVAEDARMRRFTAYDAVCPLVAKVHREVERHQRAGRAVILIGHQGHPEIEGTLGHAGNGPAFVVNSAMDVTRLPLSSDAPAAYAVQTTYSVDDAAVIVEALRARFQDLAEPPSSDICYATSNRQAAVRAVARRSNHVLVVGETFSSNACRLAEVARDHCPAVQLVASADEIAWQDLPKSGILGIGAAASTPETAVETVVSALARRYRVTLEEVRSARESAVFKRMELE